MVVISFFSFRPGLALDFDLSEDGVVPSDSCICHARARRMQTHSHSARIENVISWLFRLCQLVRKAMRRERADRTDHVCWDRVLHEDRREFSLILVKRSQR